MIDDSLVPNFKVWGYSVSVPEVSVGIGIQELAGIGVSALALDYNPVGVLESFDSPEDMAQDLETSAPVIQANSILRSHYPQ